MSIAIELDRLGRMRGSAGLRLHDTPGGRILERVPLEGEIPNAEIAGDRYDVVSIGGYSWTVANVHEIGAAAGFETVNGYFREENHVFYRWLTASQVKNVRVTWGRGRGTMAAGLTGGTFFALAAIRHGAAGEIPPYTREWFNEIVPADILAARTCFGVKIVGGRRYENRDRENWTDAGGYGGGTLPVTLSLEIGVIGPPVRDPWD